MYDEEKCEVLDKGVAEAPEKQVLKQVHILGVRLESLAAKICALEKHLCPVVRSISNTAPTTAPDEKIDPKSDILVPLAADLNKHYMVIDSISLRVNSIIKRLEI